MSKFSQSQPTLGGFLKKKSMQKVVQDDFDDDMDPDISIVKVVPSKKSTQWVSSSFDDFADFLPSKPLCASKDDTPQSSSKKRPREMCRAEPVHRLTSAKGQEKKLKKVCHDLWADKYRPGNKGELAVHKKKVEDVETWLRERSKQSYKDGAPILLLTGPAGVGKTATVQVLCKELGLDIQEWSNPEQAAYNSEQLLSSSSSFDRSRMDTGYDSQVSQFKNFLLRANKYTSLQIGNSEASSHKIIFIEEFPNIFFRDSFSLHEILRKYKHVGRCPLVFIISDTSSGESNERRLFPADLQDELRIENISFNPVAPTMMVKVLTRIASTEHSQRGISAVPTAPVLESIAMSSAGDVRSAVNALQFACKQDTYDLRRKCTSKRPTTKKSTSGSGRRLKYEMSQKEASTQGESSIGARDTSCFLFHAIGKVLYCKRGDPSDFPDHPRLPTHLSHHDRDPLLLDPEEVVEKSHLSGNYFASFLHQNYVDFYSKIEDVVAASQYLSDADFFTADWTSRTAMENYAASISTRGVIHSNSQVSRHDSKRVGVGWKPIHKSQWFGVQKQAQRNVDSACSLFKGYHWEPKVLCAELLPFINVINITLHSPGQISFVQEICRYSKLSPTSRRLERLDETDVLAEDDSQMPGSSQPTSSQQGSNKPGQTESGEGEITLSQNQVQAPAEEEEEPMIEDYDDEDYESLFLSDDSFS